MFKMLLGVKGPSGREHNAPVAPVSQGATHISTKSQQQQQILPVISGHLTPEVNIIKATEAVSQKLPTNRNSLILCERETDIISDDVIYGSDDDYYDDNYKKLESKDEIGGSRGEQQGRFGAFGMGFAPMDDPLLCEDILSCISALDEVIAEFDDPSLPYINDEEPILSPEQFQSPPPYRADKLVLIKEDPHPTKDQQLELAKAGGTSVQRKDEELFNGSNKSPSHLNELPKPTKSTRKTVSPSVSTSSSISGKFPNSSSSSSRSSGTSWTSEQALKSSSKTSTGNAKPTVAGGTYSKGSNYEIILPRIPSSDKSSSRNLPDEPIYSSIGKSRPQISLGLYSSEERSRGQVYPSEPDVDYNNEEIGGDEFYNYKSPEGLKSSKSSSSALGDLKEEWNFPSEKNLPRSLRKTRKTCFLDDPSDKAKNESDLSDCNSGEGAGGGSSVNGIVSGSSPSSSRGGSIKDQKKNLLRDDSRKIYEELVTTSQNYNAKARSHRTNSSKSKDPTDDEKKSPSLSTSSSISFTISSAVDQPIPKPRVRQQVPSSDNQQSPPNLVKYPPGKIPKPNPKPCASRPESGRGSSPSSPVQCEISSRTEEDGAHIQLKKSGAKGELEGALSGTPEVGTKCVSRTSPNNGHMMRMMMMMKPSAKNNSTGSGSSISRSSSSSSGGDPNYCRKDNVSSSSGVVVTTNSSTASVSPTHSVTNNNNNSITLITSSGVKSKGCPVVNAAKLRQGGHQNQLAQNKASAVPGSGVLDVDDGYLSMINRNEAPLLWPEEFIENETFSPDELKRLSVHLPEEESSPSDSELELEIVDYEREPSRRIPNHHNNRSLKSASAPVNRRSGSSQEKPDYFSDDSLEGESEEQEISFSHKNRGTSVSPYLSQNSHMAAFISANSPKPYHHQKITANNVTVQYQHPQQANSQASRIPKMVTGSSGKKQGRSSTGSTSSSTGSGKLSLVNQPQSVVMRKPCSFFISLTDGPELIGKSASLPKGSKVAISPPKGTDSSINEKLTKGDEASRSNSSLNPSTNPNGPTKQFTSQLPQLRHTKSINTGGPRLRSPANPPNANKRKSTSDLVTVVTLDNSDLQKTEPEVGKVENPEGSKEERVVVTSSFNRTTFLIPSPISRTTEEGRKRQRDDETDNDEDDISSDVDVLATTADPDSLQPLTLHNVQDFVSEIMDTAIRHGLKRATSSTNPVDKPLTTTTTTTLLIHDHSNSQDLKSEEPCSVEPSEVGDGHSPEITAQPGSPQAGDDGEDGDNAGNCTMSSVKEEVARDQEDEVKDIRSETVSKQLDAVVTTFLSDNQCFLTQVSVDNEFGDPTGSDPANDPGSGGQNLEEIEGSSKTEEPLELQELESRVQEGSSDLNVTVLSLSSRDNLTEEGNLNASSPVNKNKSSNGAALRDSSLLGEDKILDEELTGEESEELPPEFIPTPPPQILNPVLLSPLAASLKNLIPSESRTHRLGNNGNLHHHHHHHHHQNNTNNVRDGKATLDLLAQRITNSKNCSSPEDHLQVSQFIHDKRNIWALYDRPFDEDLLTVNSTGRGYASRSQENLMDAMCKERFTKSFSSRGQSSTLPLNCRPPTSQRRSTTFRNMFNKFRRNKQPETVIREIPEYRDDEVQSITSRETGPSEQGKKRGFFSRLFRRSRKN